VCVVCVYVVYLWCVCMWCMCDVCVCVCVCVCMFICRQRTTYLSFFIYYLPCFLRQGFFVVWSSLSRPGWLARECQGSTYLYPLPQDTSMGHEAQLFFLIWVLGLKLRFSSLFHQPKNPSVLSYILPPCSER